MILSSSTHGLCTSKIISSKQKLNFQLTQQKYFRIGIFKVQTRMFLSYSGIMVYRLFMPKEISNEAELKQCFKKHWKCLHSHLKDTLPVIGKCMQAITTAKDSVRYKREFLLFVFKFNLEVSFTVDSESILQQTWARQQPNVSKCIHNKNQINTK